MASTSPTFQFTQLIQPTSTVNAAPPAEPFDAGMAYLMGLCCGLSYTQFDAGTITPADFTSLEFAGSLAGYAASVTNLVPFTISEAIELGPTTGDVGDYATVQGGFGVQFTLTKSGQPTLQFAVITLRGTRSFEEWLDDAEAMPVPFAGALPTNDGLGSVHAGFYADYTAGTDGKTAKSGQELSATVSERAPGSLAAQVGVYVTGLTGSPRVYVTGHSLGAALATLCALDIAYNFSTSISELSLYALASPRVAVGISDSFGIPVPTMGNQNGLLMQFQSRVPSAYQIVHAADIVPIVPPTSITIGPLTVSCMQVTDAWQVGTGAVATAEISGGAVTKVSVDNSSSSGYSNAFPPTVVFSGGGGSGAAATASVGTVPVYDLGDVSVTVTNGGSGYTSPPTVTIVNSSAGTPQNVVSFCAQTGDIGNNHACLNTYIPYLKALAGGFS